MMKLLAMFLTGLVAYVTQGAPLEKSIYDFSMKRIDGTLVKLSEYKGKVLLIVNVASKCGLTPQYEGLEKLYESYKDKGLVVLGFPSNDFLSQEPGSNEEIQEFCRTKFGIKFPMHEKITVKGEGQHPLYAYLTNVKKETLPRPDGSLLGRLMAKGLLSGKDNDIKWNFEKFLLGKQGNVIERFSPEFDPQDPVIVKAIEEALKH